MVLSLHTLPIELVYRILDNLNDKALFLSCYGVCQRLNDIIDTYRRYQVLFHFTTSSQFDYYYKILSLTSTILYRDYFVYSLITKSYIHRWFID